MYIDDTYQDTINKYSSIYKKAQLRSKTLPKKLPPKTPKLQGLFVGLATLIVLLLMSSVLTRHASFRSMSAGSTALPEPTSGATGRAQSYPEPKQDSKPTASLEPVIFIDSGPAMFGVVLDIRTNMIVYIEPGSAAEQLGLQPKDRLLSINGSEIANLEQQENGLALKRIIEEALIHSKLLLHIERDGKQNELFMPETSFPFPLPARYRSKEILPTATPVILPYFYL